MSLEARDDGRPKWVDDYLTRINWTGAKPDKDAGSSPEARSILASLVTHHLAAIPFENLTPFLHESVSVDPADVIEKLVMNRRGGYCFEQNTLFQLVLEALGYAVAPVLARVVWRDPDPTQNARTHAALKVTLKESGTAKPVIVDVGFGGNALTGVLDLVSDIVQDTPHGPFKLVERDDGWMQMVDIAGEWRGTYLFTLDAVHPVDIAQANWWVSTHPESRFRLLLTAAISPSGKRLAMLNQHFTTYHLDGNKVEEMLSARKAVERLTTHFGIVHSNPEALVARLEGLNI